MHSVDYFIPNKLLYFQQNCLSPQWLRYLTTTLNYCNVCRLNWLYIAHRWGQMDTSEKRPTTKRIFTMIRISVTEFTLGTPDLFYASSPYTQTGLRWAEPRHLHISRTFISDVTVNLKRPYPLICAYGRIQMLLKQLGQNRVQW